MSDTTVIEEIFSLGDYFTQEKGEGKEEAMHDAGLNRESRISKKFQLNISD